MSYKKFVKLWVGNKPTRQVAEELDCSTAWVYQTARKLRAGGGQPTQA